MPSSLQGEPAVSTEWQRVHVEDSKSTSKIRENAAKMLNISVNTARSHMRGIYAKAGVKTQAELITLLASGLKTYGKRKS